MRLALYLSANIHKYDNQDYSRFICIKMYFIAIACKKFIAESLSKSSEMVVEIQKE
jgi:hypothetical protein